MDTSELAKQIWPMLERGRQSRKDDFHLITLAYHTTQQQIKQDTLVLRGVDTAAHALICHTDFRSQKIPALDQPVSIMVYHRAACLQLSFAANTQVDHSNELCRQRWQQSRPMSQQCYRQANAPAEPRQGQAAEPLPLERAFENFAVLTFKLQSVDALFLNHDGNRRWRGQPDGNTWSLTEIWP
jgi:hypothetical protein